MKLFAYAFAAAVLIATPALAEDLSFNFTNGSSSPVNGLYVSHTGTNSWEENLIDGKTVDAGETIPVEIADGRTVCEYDIKTTFEDGSHVESMNVNLCTLGKFTVSDAN